MPIFRSLARVGSALVAVGALTACGAAGTSPVGAEDIADTSAPSTPTPVPPQELCTELVVYWAKDELDGGSGSDYQQKGLSDGQNTILMGVVAEAKAERERNGEAAAHRLIEREAERRCAELYKDGGPTSASGGWPA